MNNELEKKPDDEQVEVPVEKATDTTSTETAEQAQSTASYNQQYPPSYTEEAAQPRKVRRVGTLTMGLALIAAGVFAIVSLFSPSLDIVRLLKLSPVVLIFLGIEILVNHFFHRDDHLKYDFLSGFVCFILICVSVGAAIIPPIYEQYGPRRYNNEKVISAEIEDMCFNALNGLPVSSLSADVSLEGYLKTEQEITYKNLRPIDYVTLNIELLNDYTDKTQFTGDCKKILDKLAAHNIPFQHIYFRYESKKGLRYSLNINDKFEAALSAEKLTLLASDNAEELASQAAEEELEQQANAA